MLPIATTTVTIERRTTGVDPYDDQSWSTVQSSVPAVVSGSIGSGRDIGGSQQTLSAKLYTDEGVEIHQADRITDETSGDTWRVQWVRTRYELGLGHVVAGLTLVTGAVN